MAGSEGDVKFKKAFCPPQVNNMLHCNKTCLVYTSQPFSAAQQVTEGNPCSEYIQRIVFPWFNACKHTAL